MDEINTPEISGDRCFGNDISNVEYLAYALNAIKADGHRQKYSRKISY